jgi:osmotically-inducible protein OsmY
MERISGENSYESASASDVPVGHEAYSPLQFEFGAEDKHNWQGRSDERIKLAVMTALHWDLAIPRDRVLVSVERGWVTLTGRVLRAYEKSCAEADARMTPGVGGVTNKLVCQSGD